MQTISINLIVPERWSDLSDGNLYCTSTSLEDAMYAQIRVLTKGDITKEAEILSLDTWRVLTELNTQAKE